MAFWFDSKKTKKQSDKDRIRELEEVIDDLQSADSKMRQLFKVLDDAIFFIDIESNKLIEATPSIEKLYGHTLSEFKARPQIWYECIHPHDKHLVDFSQPSALKGEVQFMEYRVVQPDQSIRWLEVRLLPIVKSGQITQVVGFCSNITERETIELALAESESRLNQLVEYGKTIVWEFNGNGDITYVSPVVKKIVGFEASEIIGKKHYEFLTPEFTKPEEIQLFLDLLARKENIENMDSVITGKDGSTIYTLVNGFPIYDTRKNYKGYRGTITDITERKMDQERIARNEKQYRNLFHNNPQPMFIYDLGTYRFLEVNEAAIRTYGFTHEEFLGKIITDLLITEELRRFNPNKKLLEIKDEIVTNWHHQKKSGEVMDVELLSNSIEFQGKKARLVIINDLTEKKRISDDLMAAKVKAEESDRLKSAFLTNMSHEIRTPMNGILGFLGLLSEQGLDEETKKEYIDIVNKSGQRLLETINDIIELSKIEAGEWNMVMGDFDLSDVMTYMYDVFKPLAEAKGLTLTVTEQVRGTEAIIHTDRLKVEGLLTNLIKNALKFTAKGEIRIGNRLEGDTLLFYVSDTGRGIPANRTEAIFQHFVQADTNLSRNYEGSGLGLSICKFYAEALGGKIWVESTVDVGSTFYFSIPYRIPETIIQAVGDVTESQVSTREHVILVAEDDDSSFKFLEILLDKEGLKVLRAENGRIAVEMLRENPEISLILMDLNMPEMDGLQATRTIRQFNTKVPIIAQTAYAFLSDRDKATSAGCTDFIAKPINRKMLMEKLKLYLPF